MVTLIGVLRTLITTRNPINCLPYKGKKRIKFYNGLDLNLTFPQFRDVRDCYQSLKKYAVKQVGEDSFEVDFKFFTITADANTIRLIADLLVHFKVFRMDNNKFRIEGNGFKLEGNFEMLPIVRELFIYCEYKGDFRGKVVLDIGGFQGESAVYFWYVGAKKLIIYEPIREYCDQIRTNMKLNDIVSEIHQCGIAIEDANLLVDVFASDQPKKELVAVKNVSEALAYSNADIAKIDCEGGEICLTSVPNEILRIIPFYMLELHGIEIQKNIIKKFKEAGFKIKKFSRLKDDVSIVGFKRCSDG
jgi:FkbM family methyltransferase